MTQPKPATDKPFDEMPGVFKPGRKKTELIRACLYGRGGTGKTRLMGTMPGNGLIIDVPRIEGGHLVLEDQQEHIDIKTIGAEFKEIDPIYWFLKNKHHKYRWVAIDSITAMTRLAIRKVAGEAADISGDPHSVNVKQWGVIGQMVSELVYKFSDLPIHIFWLAQEKVYGEDGEPKVTGPDTTPSARLSLIPPLMLCGRLHVEHLTDGTTERHLRVGKHSDYDTKCRVAPSLDMPDVIRNPNLKEIFGYLLSNGERPDEVVDTGFYL